MIRPGSSLKERQGLVALFVSGAAIPFFECFTRGGTTSDAHKIEEKKKRFEFSLDKRRTRSKRPSRVISICLNESNGSNEPAAGLESEASDWTRISARIHRVLTWASLAIPLVFFCLF